MQNIFKLLQDQNDGFGTRKMIQSEGRCSTGGNLHGAVGREINFRWENLERLILKDVRVEVRMTFRLLQGDSQGNMQIKEHLKIQQHQPSKRCHLELLAKAEFLRPQNLTFTVNIWEAKSVKEEDIGFLSCSHLITHTVKMGSFLCHLCLSTPPPPPFEALCPDLHQSVPHSRDLSSKTKLAWHQWCLNSASRAWEEFLSEAKRGKKMCQSPDDISATPLLTAQKEAGLCSSVARLVSDDKNDLLGQSTQLQTCKSARFPEQARNPTGFSLCEETNR